MPMSSSTVGKTTKRFRHVAEKRWLMSYAAGVGEISGDYYDTTKDLSVHPVFSVCPEWPVILDAGRVEGSESMPAEEEHTGVHASHDVLIERPIRPDEPLYTSATITTVEQRKAGAFRMMRLDTTDEESNLVLSTHQGSLSRGVSVVGGDKSIESKPVLPEIVVSCLVNNLFDGNAQRVKRYACRFSAMVLMPGTITLEVNGSKDSHVWFSAYNTAGESAIRGGYMEVR